MRLGAAPLLTVAPGPPTGAAERRAFPARVGSNRRVVVQLGATAMLLVAAFAGVRLDAVPVTLVTCAALLILGLPHGSFDMLLLVQAARAGFRRLAAMLLVYVGLGVAMAAVWWALPTVALVGFLAIATVHFAEDWREAGSAFAAQGIALAVVAAPAWLHPREIADLLGVVATARGGVLVGAALTAIAPVGIVTALVGLAMVARNGARAHAAGGLIALVGLLVLPPLIGFALFFCLLHSPLHFAQARREAGREAGWRWATVVVPVTLLAIGVAGGLYLIEPIINLPSGVVQASFRTLSILTLPHVAMPMILKRRRAWVTRLDPARARGR